MPCSHSESDLSPRTIAPRIVTHTKQAHAPHSCTSILHSCRARLYRVTSHMPAMKPCCIYTCAVSAIAYVAVEATMSPQIPLLHESLMHD